MTIRFYEASVPVFHRYLSQLSACIEIAAIDCRSENIADASIFEARLAPDMLPFKVQIEIAANFAPRTCFPLAGLATPTNPAPVASFEGLRAHIARARKLIDSIPQESFDRAGDRIIHDKAGQASLALPAAAFLLQYALPNFFFHVAVSFSLLRSIGIPIGKEDFDGYHAYARRL